MRIRFLVTCLTLLVTAHALGQSSTTDRAKKAIADYERPKMPEFVDLSGLTVGVKSLQPEHTAENRPPTEELEYLVAAYVERFAKSAGARTVAAEACDDDCDLLIHVACSDSVKISYGVKKPASNSTGLAKYLESEGFDYGKCHTSEDIRKAARELAVLAVGFAKNVLEDHGIPSKPQHQDSTAAQRLTRAARLIVPEGSLRPDRVAWFCRMFERVAISNRSLVYFDTSVESKNETVVLLGATNAPSAMKGLLRSLKSLGIEKVRNEMRILPDADQLGEKFYGACIAPSVISHTTPSLAAGEQSELLYGEPVYLLDKREGFYLLHGGDGYWGWVPEQAVFPMNKTTFRAYMDHDRATVIQNLDAESLSVPPGARVAVHVGADHVETGTTDSNPVSFHLICPDGTRVPIQGNRIRVESQVSNSSIGLMSRDDAANSRVERALDYLYVPYKFGGRSPLGLDCSGLVGTVLAQTGGAPARDAWQLAFAGRLTATRWAREGMQAGDIVYFIDERGTIYHTGIAISSTHIVDSSPPAVQIGSIVPGDRLYDERMDRDFFMAKRP